MAKLKPEKQLAFGGVEATYEDADGKVVTKVLSPPTQVLELHLPTVEEITPLHEAFGGFVRDLMKEESDPEFLTAYENYQEVQDFYEKDVAPKVIDILLSDYSAEDRDMIFTHIQTSQLVALYRIVARVFNVGSVLKVLHDTEGVLPKN